MIAWQGCHPDQLIAMVRTGTAGGQPPDENTLPPDKLDVEKQVGEKTSLPEFTMNKVVGEGFGTGAFIVAVAIKQKYLSEGSGSEDGQIAYKTAPLETIYGFKSGRPFVGGPSSRTNRSSQSLIQQAKLLNIKEGRPKDSS